MFVYILYSIQADKYYVGVTDNPEARLQKHISNHQGFTAIAKDWEIKYLEFHSTKTNALKREKQLKNWKSRKMLECLIHKGLH